MTNPPDRPEDAASSVPVVFIASCGRSGSTLLDLALGSVPGMVSTGELRHLWTRGLQQRRLCGCGTPVPDCPHWSAVIDAIGGYPRTEGALDHHAVEHDMQAVARTRHTRRLLAGRDDETVARLHDLSARTYRAVREVTGASVVVDSSKMPADAALAATAPGVDVHLVHLTRDPRAVAWSWRRPKMMTDVVPPRPISTISANRSARQWLSWNPLIERVGQHAASVTRVRYEDLIADPAATLERIVSATGLATAPIADMVGDGSISIRGSHTVAGNPARFDTGTVSLKLDDRWRDDQPTLDRWQATAITAPLLRRYGYRAARRA
ncbi:sulfotransferase [Actinospongicola halichondriae]|uniref:sulfotransferase n=1 Tax=Actinospongicola halichondriae TaxID=3236844 RepID=UPI003D47001D